jgi:hypothetical protein
MRKTDYLNLTHLPLLELKIKKLPFVIRNF